MPNEKPGPPVTFACSRCQQPVKTTIGSKLELLNICEPCQKKRFADGEKLKKATEAEEADRGR